MSISIDDRTASENYGYAFRCIDGSGIVVVDSEGTTVQNCRVERHLLPTRAVKDEHQLGVFTKKNPPKGTLMSQEVWDAAYVDNWHQGSGIVVNGPRRNLRTQLLGNQIDNAAQGIDLHCDQVIVANNIVNNAFIGIKAMHGSRSVLITRNQFIKNDLWAIGPMPSAASGVSRAADVLIHDNIIYDSGRDLPLVDGQPRREPPRYQYSVRSEVGSGNSPQGLHFSGNIFHPGTAGVSNVELPP